MHGGVGAGAERSRARRGNGGPRLRWITSFCAVGGWRLGGVVGVGEAAEESSGAQHLEGSGGSASAVEFRRHCALCCALLGLCSYYSAGMAWHWHTKLDCICMPPFLISLILHSSKLFFQANNKPYLFQFFPWHWLLHGKGISCCPQGPKTSRQQLVDLSFGVLPCAKRRSNSSFPVGLGDAATVCLWHLSCPWRLPESEANI